MSIPYDPRRFGLNPSRYSPEYMDQVVTHALDFFWELDIPGAVPTMQEFTCYTCPIARFCIHTYSPWSLNGRCEFASRLDRA